MLVSFVNFVCHSLSLSLFASNTTHRRDTMKLEKGERGGKFAGINEFVRWRVLHRSNHRFDGIESGCFVCKTVKSRTLLTLFRVKSFEVNSRRFINRIRCVRFEINGREEGRGGRNEMNKSTTDSRVQETLIFLKL